MDQQKKPLQKLVPYVVVVEMGKCFTPIPVSHPPLEAPRSSRDELSANASSIPWRTRHGLGSFPPKRVGGFVKFPSKKHPGMLI